MKKFLKIGLIVSSILIAIIGYSIYWAFFSMNRLPTGEFLTEEVSPDGIYTVKAYVTNGGATVAYSVRGELIFNNKKKKPKNIYWQYREEHAKIEWLDEQTVVINGRTLKVPNETYDFRNSE